MFFINKHALFTLHVEVATTFVTLFVDIQVGQALHLDLNQLSRHVLEVQAFGGCVCHIGLKGVPLLGTCQEYISHFNVIFLLTFKFIT